MVAIPEVSLTAEEIAVKDTLYQSVAQDVIAVRCIAPGFVSVLAYSMFHIG
jgi:hypothetical protein